MGISRNGKFLWDTSFHNEAIVKKGQKNRKPLAFATLQVIVQPYALDPNPIKEARVWQHDATTTPIAEGEKTWKRCTQAIELETISGCQRVHNIVLWDSFIQSKTFAKSWRVNTLYRLNLACISSLWLDNERLIEKDGRMDGKRHEEDESKEEWGGEGKGNNEDDDEEGEEAEDEKDELKEGEEDGGGVTQTVREEYTGERCMDGVQSEAEDDEVEATVEMEDEAEKEFATVDTVVNETFGESVLAVDAVVATDEVGEIDDDEKRDEEAVIVHWDEEEEEGQWANQRSHSINCSSTKPQSLRCKRRTQLHPHPYAHTCQSWTQKSESAEYQLKMQ